MKAVTYERYGPPDVLELTDVDRPVPGDEEVLVDVHSASVNSWDWDLLTGTTQGRIFGTFSPGYRILGADIAGRVAEVGQGVADFNPGDEVYGDISGCGWGGFAESVCARAAVLAKKPPGMTFEQAAAIPQGAVLALQGLRDNCRVRPGMRILINGACGATGVFAIQIAKHHGAVVTAVDSADKLDAAREFGADHVIDYKRVDYTRIGLRYDGILDVIARRSVLDYRRALAQEGVFAVVGGRLGTILSVIAWGSLIGLAGGSTMGAVMHAPNREDLNALSKLFDAGALRPAIDSTFPLAETRAAFERYGSGRFIGKIVVRVRE